MKKFLFFLSTTFLTVCFVFTNSCSQPTKAGKTESSVSFIFKASSPCDAVSKTMLQIPENTACELIKWELVLNQELNTSIPSGYTLTYVYGMSKPNTLDILHGGTRIVKEGRWSIGKGRKQHSEADVYQLFSANSQPYLFFLKLDDKLLHLLAPDKSLMVGNGGWSYTLNKTSEN